MKTNGLLVKYLWMLLPCCAACQRDDKAEGTGRGVPVRVAQPEVRAVTLTREYPGYLKADKTVQFTARVSGTLLRCYYRPGQQVQAGAALFLIDPSTYEEQVAEAQATLRNAEANLSYTQATYERTQRAAAADAVAQIQVLQTQAEYLQAVAQMEQAQASLRLAEISLGYCHIAAPFTGHVTLNAYDIGNYINAAENPVLATLYKDDTLHVYFNVSENQYLQRQLRVGRNQSQTTLFDDVTLKIPALSEAASSASSPTATARLEYTAPDVTLSTGTLLLRAVLPNPEGWLRDGMYVLATLPYGRMEAALLVPDAAVGHDQAGSYLYVLSPEDVVERRAVTLGQLIADSLRIVASGLTAEEHYVVDAGLKVRVGMKVDAQF